MSDIEVGGETETSGEKGKQQKTRDEVFDCKSEKWSREDGQETGTGYSTSQQST